MCQTHATVLIFQSTTSSLKSATFENFWWRHCMWFGPPNQKSWLRLSGKLPQITCYRYRNTTDTEHFEFFYRCLWSTKINLHDFEKYSNTNILVAPISWWNSSLEFDLLWWHEIKFQSGLMRIWLNKKSPNIKAISFIVSQIFCAQ